MYLWYEVISELLNMWFKVCDILEVHECNILPLLITYTLVIAMYILYIYVEWTVGGCD